MVLVEVKSGDKYEGVLRTFSPNVRDRFLQTF